MRRRYIIVLSLSIFAVLCGPGALDADASRRKVGLDAKEISRVVRQDIPKIRQCYVRHAMKQKQADGKVSLELVIRANGDLESLDVIAPSVRGNQFSRCVERVVDHWQFPESGGETEATYPLLFVHTHTPAGPNR